MVAGESRWQENVKECIDLMELATFISSSISILLKFQWDWVTAGFVMKVEVASDGQAITHLLASGLCHY